MAGAGEPLSVGLIGGTAVCDGIARERVDELLHFLRDFSVPSPDLEPKWDIPVSPPGTLVMTSPTYPKKVTEFFRLASQRWWCDFEYGSSDVARMLGDDEMISRASLSEVRSMLTFCVWGERFSEGHWANVVRSGRIGALLRRLAELRDTLPDG